MSLTYSIDPSRRLVTILGEYADADEWRAVLTALLRDPDFQRGFGFVRDLRDARNPVDVETVMRIIRVVRDIWPVLGPSRAAIVTPREMDSAAVVAHALAQDHNLPLRAFTSYDAALDWVCG